MIEIWRNKILFTFNVHYIYETQWNNKEKENTNATRFHKIEWKLQ